MDQQGVINVLAWAFAVVGGSFCVLLAWFAVRIVSQLDRLNDMVTVQLHEHDLRIVKLEAWRDHLAQRRASDNHPGDSHP